jgi:hypothetical protein
MLGLAHAGGLSALTPQQYCEALEARSPGSFEILNMEDSTSPVLTSTIKRSFLLGYPSGQTVTFEACGMKYSAHIPNCRANYDQSQGIYSIMFCDGPVTLTLKDKPTEIPFCPTNGQGVICDSNASCYGMGLYSANSIHMSQGPLVDNQTSFQESIFGSMGRACANRRGINYKNGNSCIISDLRLSAGDIPSAYASNASGIYLNLTETKVDSSSRVRVKYCAAGSFHLATVATGPLSSSFDSVISCIRGSGQGIAGDFTSIKPLQGDVLSDLKLWLIDRNGCK